MKSQGGDIQKELSKRLVFIYRSEFRNYLLMIGMK